MRKNIFLVLLVTLFSFQVLAQEENGVQTPVIVDNGAEAAKIQQEFQAAQVALSQTLNELNVKRATLDGLKGQVDGLNTKFSSLQDLVDQAEAQKAVSTAELKSMQDDRDALKREVEKLNARLKEAEDVKRVQGNLKQESTLSFSCTLDRDDGIYVLRDACDITVTWVAQPEGFYTPSRFFVVESGTPSNQAIYETALSSYPEDSPRTILSGDWRRSELDLSKSYSAFIAYRKNTADATSSVEYLVPVSVFKYRKPKVTWSFTAHLETAWMVRDKKEDDKAFVFPAALLGPQFNARDMVFPVRLMVGAGPNIVPNDSGKVKFDILLGMEFTLDKYFSVGVAWPIINAIDEKSGVPLVTFGMGDLLKSVSLGGK